MTNALEDCTKEQLLDAIGHTIDKVGRWAAEAGFAIEGYLETLQDALVDADDDCEAREIIDDGLPNGEDAMHILRSFKSSLKDLHAGEGHEAAGILLVDQRDLLSHVE